MTIASEFYDMAVEMLGDPEIGFDGTLALTSATASGKPWAPNTTSENVAIRLFYTDQKAGYVNGSPILKGEKVFLCYAPEGYNFGYVNGSGFTDHNGRKWKVNAVESIGAGNQDIVYCLKIGV